MRKLILVALALLSTEAYATTTTVGDFRGTVATSTSTGSITYTLGVDTTLVRINASSEVHFVGMDNPSDGRIVIFMNVGTANAYFWHEHSSASAASYRFTLDANTGSRILYGGGQSMAMAVYDGTSSRWRFVAWDGYNSSGPLNINGSSIMYGTLTQLNGTFEGTSATLADDASGTRLTLKSTDTGDNGSMIRWRDYSGSDLFSMGPDYFGDQTNNFWMYDYGNSATNLLIDNAGESWLSFGTSVSGFDWNEDDWDGWASGLLRTFIHGYFTITMGENFVAYNVASYYQPVNAYVPTLGANCDGSGTATFHQDSGDSRGAITLGTGATQCTMTFAVPWDILHTEAVEDRRGFPICVATSSTQGRSIAVTNISDHFVTFEPSASGVTTIYYHCDGIVNYDVFE